MMRCFIHADTRPYGTERRDDGLRLANALAKSDPATRVSMVLLANAVSRAKNADKTLELQTDRSKRRRWEENAVRIDTRPTSPSLAWRKCA